jgi:hypothetical protein
MNGDGVEVPRSREREMESEEEEIANGKSREDQVRAHPLYL